MNKELIVQMQSQFDALAQTHPEATDVEFWFARDLQEPLGYARWENFLTPIRRAIESCKTTGYDAEHHFRGVTKMIELGNGAKRTVEDFMLTHHPVPPAGGLFADADDCRQESGDGDDQSQRAAGRPARGTCHHERARAEQYQRAPDARSARHQTGSPTARGRHQETGAPRQSRRKEAGKAGRAFAETTTRRMTSSTSNSSTSLPTILLCVIFSDFAHIA